MRPLLIFALLSTLARSEVILQYFETEWDEIHRRTPEIAEIGYDALWIPSPCKFKKVGEIWYPFARSAESVFPVPHV
jgi:hypothetical protein